LASRCQLAMGLILLFCLAITPIMSAQSGMWPFTTAPAATKAYRPSVEPHTIVALAPMEAPRRTTVGAYCEWRKTSDLGLVTLVNTHDGPQNTFFRDYAGIQRDVVLELAVGTNAHARCGEDLLPEVAALADRGVFANVAEVPNPGAGYDLAGLIDKR